MGDVDRVFVPRERIDPERALVVLERVVKAARDGTSDILAEVCRLLVESGELKLAWIGRVEPRTGNVLPVASAGDRDGYLAALTATARPTVQGMGPTGRAARERRPAVCDDFETDPRMEPWRTAGVGRGFGSSIAIPIETPQGLRILSVYASGPRHFTPSVQRWLEAVGDALALGLVERESHAAAR